MKVTMIPRTARTASPASSDGAPSEEFERAMRAYDAGSYGEAAQLLQHVAEHSHVRAQEVLGMMYWYGPRLYGENVPRRPVQAIEILDKAAEAGSQFAKQLLGMIDRRLAQEANSAAERGFPE